MLINPNYYDGAAAGTNLKNAFSVLLSNRIILLFDQISDDVACSVIAQMLALDAEDPDQDIQLYIHSPGGSVRAGLAVYDVMRRLHCDVATVCVGQAASMAALLLAAGTKGKRYSLENGSIMIHQALGAIPYGQATDIRIQAQMIEATKNQMNRLLAQATGKSEAEIEACTDRDTYMTPQDAKAFGLIDEVIRND